MNTNTVKRPNRCVLLGTLVTFNRVNGNHRSHRRNVRWGVFAREWAIEAYLFTRPARKTVEYARRKA